jgi:hypothetical protein
MAVVGSGTAHLAATVRLMGNDEHQPTDPISELAAAAAQTHELFLTYVRSGFTEMQALYLTASVITASARPPGP